MALGPIIDQKQVDRVHSIVQASIAAGAKLEAGGSHDGLFYQPTVLSNVKPGMVRILRNAGHRSPGKQCRRGEVRTVCSDAAR